MINHTIVVGLDVHKKTIAVAALYPGSEQVDADHGGKDSAQEEEETDGHQVQPRDALVVRGQ